MSHKVLPDYCALTRGLVFAVCPNSCSIDLFLPSKHVCISIMLKLKFKYMCMGPLGIHELCPYLFVL